MDEIVSIATFSDLDAAGGKTSLSPDGRYLVAITEHASADHQQLQADVLVWRTAELTHPGPVPSPTRLASFTGSSGPLIQTVRWAGDGRSMVVLVTEDLTHSSLWQLRPGAGSQRVSLPGQNVRSFDLAASTIIYTATAASPVKAAEKSASGENAEQVGTDKSLQELVFPGEGPHPSNWVDFWRWTGGIPEEIPVKGPLRLSEDRNPMALSPDGRLAVVDFPVSDVPATWANFAADTRLNVTAGWKSGPQTFTDENVVVPHQFALLDLHTGVATPIVDGPDAQSRGFLLPSPSLAAWAADGSHVAISATFIPGQARPCVVVVTLPQRSASCVTTIGQSFDRVSQIKFASRDGKVFRLDLQRLGEGRFIQKFQTGAPAANWRLSRSDPWIGGVGSRFIVRQDLNTPPLLVDRRPGATRVIYDPNPQLQRAKLAKWATLSVPLPGKGAFDIGLLVPDGAPPPGGFPLIIQTHGFDPSSFSASGIYEAPFAGQAFVRAGFAVTQLPMDCPVGDMAEVPCHLARYHATIDLLAARKIVDPNKVAIMGFSRTAIHVLAALTDPTFKFEAAVLQTGYLNTISQYFDSVNDSNGFVNGWMAKMIGGKPYGKGLAGWQAISPSLHYDRLVAPLRVEASGKFDTVLMWEPFAAMRDQGRPADLLVLPQASHPLTNPAQRAASQQGAVDWFVYWLQGKKDPSPDKQAEYLRWDEMRANAGNADNHRPLENDDRVPMLPVR
ncbi:prolyl oligopeptidase family serine peptidase [Sphingomonas oryzagri]